MRTIGTVASEAQARSVSRNLERIADLATPIAEDVVFMVEGEVIRHRYPGGTPRAARAVVFRPCGAPRSR